MGHTRDCYSTFPRSTEKKLSQHCKFLLCLLALYQLQMLRKQLLSIIRPTTSLPKTDLLIRLISSKFCQAWSSIRRLRFLFIAKSRFTADRRERSGRLNYGLPIIQSKNIFFLIVFERGRLQYSLYLNMSHKDTLQNHALRIFSSSMSQIRYPQDYCSISLSVYMPLNSGIGIY